MPFFLSILPVLRMPAGIEPVSAFGLPCHSYAADARYT